jgi:hypothetical protein
MFDELYYWMYTRLTKIKSNDDPAFNAYFLIGFLQVANIGTVFVIINYFAKIQFAKNAYIYIGLSLAFVLAVLNYFTLYSKRQSIFKKYEQALPTRRKKGLLFFWIYTILSLIIFWTLVAFLVTPRH